MIRVLRFYRSTVGKKIIMAVTGAIWIGFVIGSGVHWFLPIAVLIFALEYSLIVRYEEGVLESVFGEEYVCSL